MTKQTLDLPNIPRRDIVNATRLTRDAALKIIAKLEADDVDWLYALVMQGESSYVISVYDSHADDAFWLGYL